MSTMNEWDKLYNIDFKGMTIEVCIIQAISFTIIGTKVCCYLKMESKWSITQFYH